MRVVMLYHSLISDWNHGNAHFLRGIASELRARGHAVAIYEPKEAWSVQNLVAEHGEEPIQWFHAAYPGLTSVRYRLEELELAQALDGADLVLVHEWNDPELVRRVGEQRAAGGRFTLFFHDTHHRAVSRPGELEAFDLRHYDGVLAFGSALRELYLRRGWASRVHVWHEAADVRTFRPLLAPKDGDVVWIGNWGDEERSAELREFLLEPVSSLRIRARVHGVRYPPEALEALRQAGIEHRGWLPNFRVPEVLARHRVTLHVPRRPYAHALPGVPTIRPFEALACRVPLVCAPWEDTEGLFSPGRDFWIASDGREMARHLRQLLNEPQAAQALAEHGHATVLRRHTCAHRVDELLSLARGSAGGGRPATA